MRMRAAVLAAVVVALMWVVSTPVEAASATISATISPRSIALGQTTYVEGTVSPAGATTRVVVQRGVGGRWSDRQGGTVTNGRFRIGIKPSQGGVYALRVRSNGGSVVSNTVYVKVTFPPAQAIRNVDWARFPHDTDEFFVCGNGDGVRQPLGRGKVAYGDLTGDGVEEAAVIVDCVLEPTKERYSVLLAYGLVRGAPKLIDLTTGTASSSRFYAVMVSPAINSRRIGVTIVASPWSSCTRCVPFRLRESFRLHNGRLESTLAG